MKKIVFAIFFVVFFANNSSARNSAASDSCIFHAIELSIIHQYQRADSLLDLFIEKNPDHPAGYFFKAACLQSKMMDYENYSNEPEFVRLLQEAIRCADAALDAKNRTDELENLFFKASALSYLAFQQGKEKHYWRAFEQGIQAIRLLNKIVKKEPEFYDAYLGIGTFKFWRSQLTRALNWLPLVPDEREKGLDMVKLAIAKGTYSRYAAMNGIVWMLLEIHRPDAALHWAESGLHQFPGSRFFLWGAAKSAFAMNNFSLAKNYFGQILHSMAEDSIASSYNIYICHLNLAKCKLQLNDVAGAKKEIDFLKNMKLSKATKKRLQKQIRETKNLTKKIGINSKSQAANSK